MKHDQVTENIRLCSVMFRSSKALLAMAVMILLLRFE